MRLMPKALHRIERSVLVVNSNKMNDVYNREREGQGGKEEEKDFNSLRSTNNNGRMSHVSVIDSDGWHMIFRHTAILPNLIHQYRTGRMWRRGCSSLS